MLMKATETESKMVLLEKQVSSTFIHSAGFKDFVCKMLVIRFFIDLVYLSKVSSNEYIYPLALHFSLCISRTLSYISITDKLYSRYL